MTKLRLFGDRGPLRPQTWQRRLRAWMAKKAESTRRTYERDFDAFVAWGEFANLGDALAWMTEGEPEDVRVRVQGLFIEYEADLLQRPVWASSEAKRRGEEPVRQGLAPATVSRHLAALRALVALAQIAGRCPDVKLPKSPSLGLRDTSGIGRTAWLSVLDALDAALDDAEAGSQAHDVAIRDRAILRLLHDCGLRRIEVIRLELGDVSEDGLTLRLWGKGKHASRKQPWPLAPAPAAAVAAWLAVRGREGGPLFTHRSSPAGLSPSSINKLVARWGRKAGLPRATPHQLRHTAITTLARRTNGNLVAMQGFARHANPRTTKLYVDNLGDDVRQMQELLGDEE